METPPEIKDITPDVIAIISTISIPISITYIKVNLIGEISNYLELY